MGCNKNVSGGGSRVLWRCSLEAGHDGPCAAKESPRSLAERRTWEARQRVGPEDNGGPTIHQTPPQPHPASAPIVPSTTDATTESGYRLREGDQPLPKAADGAIMHELLIEMLRSRLALGIERYGQPLRAFNGRNAARDALEEAVDLSVYLQQSVIERERAIGLLMQAVWPCMCGEPNPGLATDILNFLESTGAMPDDDG